jgi:nicotinate-nucleotide adenylyltransferase
LKKIGIYGGTFDPIHHAHLILAREALEILQLNKIIFVPAALAPHKLSQPAAPAPVRFEMVRAAIAGEYGFALSSCELDRAAPSYSIDTVRELQAKDSSAEFYFLLGEDNVSELHAWHEIDSLKQMVNFVVLDRAGSETKHSFKTIRRHVDISATEIRKRVATGQSIRYLVPETVERIIHRENLYQESTDHT